MAGHERFDSMAVGHVLGGLDEVDAAAFRAHLLECRDCRRRVNELRDIASDLAATEREERRAATLAAVDVETRTEQAAPEEADVAPMRRWPWGVVVLALVPLLVLGTLAWAVWQRAQTDLSAAVAASQQQVLDITAAGTPLTWSSPEEVEGDIEVHEGRVGINVTGLPELQPNQGLVIWLLAADGTTVERSRTYLPSQVGGSLVAALQVPADADRLVVTIEDDVTAGLQAPDGYRLVDGVLPAE